MQPNHPILSLRVARFNEEPVAEPMTIEFGPAGGTIGRATDCTLVLPDQQRAISRVHARIEYRGGEYLLCDLGSNPSVLNQRAIGGTREARLTHGDSLLIGTYLLEVSIAERGPGQAGVPGARDPLASAKVLGGTPFGQEPDSPLGVLGLDPLGQPGLGAPPPISSQPGFAGSQSDHVSPEWQAFSAPEPAPAPAAARQAGGVPGTSGISAGGIPAEYDPLSDALTQWEAPAGAGQDPLAQAVAQGGTAVSPLFAPPPGNPAAVTPPPGGPTGLSASLLEPSATGGSATPFDDLLAEVPASAPAPSSPDAPGESPFAMVTGNPVLVPAQAPAQFENRASNPASVPAGESAPASVGASSSAGAPAAASESATMTALLEGLGLDPARAPNLPAPAFAHLIGVMLRIGLRGTMTVLRSRSMTKREARLDTTLIVARDNNPLKFFPDVDSALVQMLTGRGTGYLPPAEAIERAFGDIEAHELAMLAGMRAALAAVLGRFDPASIEAQLKEQGVLDKVLSNRKARLWDRFVELQAGIAREADDDFQKLYGKAFSDAYEAQIEALRSAREAGDPCAAEKKSTTS
ncbi:type VI secretion system-associated FHA domain protein TagH [Trinickia mobilis]|uniref:type VI secretion system-associated FHA domain protein TagH n=1 Tax=Trinickia mobilis TaxID=2816356 RepID=UPI001A8EF3FF|nr:type VI secretion system-associated FHA domain protein TagH [Trinickia mobilis]